MHSIWAVARNTIKQALRMKVALIFVVLLLTLLPLMFFSSTGDDTLKGRLQTFVSYGLSLTSLLLCILTIIVSIYTVASDIEQRQVYTVITKPIRRFEFLLGKLLGVLLLGTTLLIFFSALIYTFAVYAPRYLHPSEADVIQAENEFFTARKAAKPPDPDVSKEVAEARQRLKRSGDINQIYAGMSSKQIDAQLTKLRKLAKRTVNIGHELLWEFENIRPVDPNGSVFVRFKYQVGASPPDSELLGQWGIGDYRPYKYGTQSDGKFYAVQRTDPVRTLREIKVPADAVAEDGYFAVIFRNPPENRTTVTFPEPPEVLYKADNFTSNFIRAAILILCRLIFLACLGIFASTFLSFPVAILLCIAIFFTATVSVFVIDSFDFLSDNLEAIYSYSLKLVVRLLPQFDKFSPTKYIVPAELLTWSVLGRVVLFMVCVKSLLLLLLALIIFRFRELARITV